ncbi:MAG: phage/plasmid primase, P4 family [Pseudomonadota bacterium]
MTESGQEEVRARFAAAETIAPDPGAPASSSEGPLKPPQDPGPDDELLRRCAALSANDYGNGQRLVLHFGQDLMFVPRVGWFVWTGAVWEQDKDKVRVHRTAQRLSGLIAQEVPFLPVSEVDARLLGQERDARARAAELRAIKERSEPQTVELGELISTLDAIDQIKERRKKARSAHRSFANTSGNSNRIVNAITEAAALLAVSVNDLDQMPLDLNTEGGVLRFAVTGGPGEEVSATAALELVEHDREDRITKLAPVLVDFEARCLEFDRFLERVQPDIEMREFLQRWIGASFLGKPIQRLVFLHGGGANGKSVLVDLMARIAGSYAATARIESLTGNTRRGGGEPTPDLVPLMGARMVRTSEPDEGQRLQEGLIKELTGGEPMLVRALYGESVEVTPYFKLTISGNHKPEIRGGDDGIWRRVLLVPFDIQIPEPERDSDLGEKLRAERSGIMNWVIDGIFAYLERGLDPPGRVLDETRAYREESDPIGTFLAASCEFTGDAKDQITSKDMAAAMNFWVRERGETAWKDTTISRRLAAKAGKWRDPRTGRTFEKGKSSRSLYHGLRFREAFKRRFDEDDVQNSGRGYRSDVVE